jgi:hypothetical protein
MPENDHDFIPAMTVCGYQVRTTEKKSNSGHSGEMVMLDGAPLGAVKVDISLA